MSQALKTVFLNNFKEFPLLGEAYSHDVQASNRYAINLSMRMICIA